MTKQTLLFALAICGASVAAAQAPLGENIDNPRVREKVQAARVAYITDRLSLTPTESQQFWAINNEYEAKRDAIRDRYRASSKLELMSDAEVEQYLRDRFDMEAQLLALKKQYFERFKDVISVRKIAMFQKADREFRLELLKKVRERRDNRRRWDRN
ncbi:MAG: hypothetical protein GVY26_10000 [Bacteroidetes bacterium]|jgi:hypothetical protein|nr:hypothetical protein [Bacteroidota bacterium]